MVVGQDVAVVSVDDDAGPGTGHLALSAAGHIREPEKAAKRLVAKVSAGGDGLAHTDIDYRRRHPLHERRQARQFLAIDHCR